MNAKSRTVEETKVNLAKLMLPQDANPAGNVHGGTIMKLIDDAAAAVAMRHSRSNTVTVSVDRLQFHAPVHVGDLVTLRASMNWVGNSSMEVGVRVEAEDLKTGEVTHAVSSYLTFVALDDNEKPRRVPSLVAETEKEIRRLKDGEKRHRARQQDRADQRKR